MIVVLVDIRPCPGWIVRVQTRVLGLKNSFHVIKSSNSEEPAAVDWS